MITPLDAPLRRAITIDGQPYVVTLTPAGVRIVKKGFRKGIEVSWQDILSGDVTLRAQLNRSVGQPSSG